MVPHLPGRCICKLCKIIGHTATECPWLEEAKATTKPPKTDEKDEEPEVLFCLHCRSETHRIEDCAAYKVAQAKGKRYGVKDVSNMDTPWQNAWMKNRNKGIRK